MAADYRASSFGDTHFGTRTNTSVTLGVSPVAGDIIHLVCSTGNSISPGLPSDFTAASGSPHTWANSDLRRVAHCWKISDGTEGDTFTFTHVSDGTWAAGWITEGGAASSPIDFVSFFKVNAGQDPATSGTTSEANVLLYALFTYLNNAGTVTTPSGFSQRGDLTNTFGVADLLQASAGATGTVTYDTTTNDDVLILLFGVKSAAASGPTIDSVTPSTFQNGETGIVISGSGF